MEASTQFRSRRCLLDTDEVVYVHTVVSSYLACQRVIVDESSAADCANTTGKRSTSPAKVLKSASPMSADDLHVMNDGDLKVDPWDLLMGA